MKTLMFVALFLCGCALLGLEIVAWHHAASSPTVCTGLSKGDIEYVLNCSNGEGVARN